MSEAHYQREVEWYETLLTQKSKNIVELQAEIERLKDGEARLQAALEVTSSDCKEAFAENERLRVVLSGVLWMAEEWFEHGGDETTLADDFEKQIEAARAELEVK